MSDYADILKQSWDELPELVPLPQGSWLLRARGASYQPAKDADKSPTVTFIYSAKEPMDDVSQEELEALGSNYDVSSNRIFARFFVSDGADWDAVRKHLAKHGVEVKGKTIEESLKAIKGTEVIAYLGQRTYTNNAGQDVVENNPSNFTAVE